MEKHGNWRAEFSFLQCLPYPAVKWHYLKKNSINLAHDEGK